MADLKETEINGDLKVTGKINNYKLAQACEKSIDESLEVDSTSNNIPTSKAVADLIYAEVGDINNVLKTLTTPTGYNLLPVENPLEVSPYMYITLPLEAGVYTLNVSEIITTDSNITRFLIKFMLAQNGESICSVYFTKNDLLLNISLTQNISGIYIYAAQNAASGQGVTTTYKDLMLVKGHYTKETIFDYEPYKE